MPRGGSRGPNPKSASGEARSRGGLGPLILRGNEMPRSRLWSSDGDIPQCPFSPNVAVQSSVFTRMRSFLLRNPMLAILHLAAAKKPRQRNTLALSETVRSEVGMAPASVGQTPCRGTRIGDEGRAVGCVPPTALLSDAHSRFSSSRETARRSWKMRKSAPSRFPDKADLV